MKVYISGKITGLEPEDYLTHFASAEKKLSDQGYSVINPAKVNAGLPQDTTHEEYMRMSMCMLEMCDTIYLLDNNRTSKGAKMELEYAKHHNYKVLLEVEEDA